MKQNDNIQLKFGSRVIIEDTDTNEILLDKSNAVHPENMARVIARGLANESHSYIWKVAVGNGGSYTDSVGALNFNAPNTIGTTASLYNQTYSELADAVGNSVTSYPSSTDITSLVEIIFVIAPDEPGSGQWLTDAEGTGNVNEPGGYAYEFDELGLFAENPLGGDPLLLTHIVFHPIAKTQNRNLRLRYTLTISVS